MVFYDYSVFGNLIGTDWEHFNQTSGRSGTILVLRLIKERPVLTKRSSSLEPEITDIAVYFYAIMSINRRVQRLRICLLTVNFGITSLTLVYDLSKEN